MKVKRMKWGLVAASILMLLLTACGASDAATTNDGPSIVVYLTPT